MTALARAVARLRRMTPAERSALLRLVTEGDRDSIDRIETALASLDDDSFLSPGGPLAGAFGARLVAAVEDAERGRELVGRRLGNVRVDRELGGGGFGRVYLGHDEKLDRPVAVKALRATQRLRAEARERFEREARLLSRLDHPNICRIYGLAEEEDADYLLLEYVDGERLTRAAAEADFSTRLGLVRQVAKALEAAHEAGIIHRDLKPDNILVTSDGVAKVLDLGIARFEEHPESTDRSGEAPEGSTPLDLTRQGARLGTILYMSPEQARGEPVTKASDLFALGLLVHELFGGARAYDEDDPARLLERVQQGAVRPFAHSDRELAALAADLLRSTPFGRPTAGEVVERIDAILERPRRRRRRRLRRAVIGGAAAIALAILAGWWILQTKAERDLASAAELLSQAKDIEWRMRAEHLSPAHDITPARDEIRQSLERLAARIDELGRPAAARGRYALARAALSVGDLQRARQEAEAAWESGFQTPEVAYTLGRVLAEILRGEVERIQRRTRREDLEAELARVRTDLGDTAVGYLERARGADVGPPLYVEALLAISELDYPRALAALERIDVPWFYEAVELEAWTRFRVGMRLGAGGSNEELLAELSRAEEAYRAAAAIGPSYPPASLGLCQVETYRILREALSPDQVEDRANAAIAACERTLALEPDSAVARTSLVSMLTGQAQAAGNLGRDPLELLTRGEGIAREGLAATPDNPDLQRSLLNVLTLKASTQRLRGTDPEETYAEGRRMVDRLLSHEPIDASYLNSAVVLLLDNGYFLTSQGRSPVGVLERGIEIAQRILEVQSDATITANLAACYYVLALYKVEHGLEPTQTLAEGIAAVEGALAALPGQIVPLRILGLLHGVAHSHAARTGGDIERALAGARAAYGEALEINPQFVWARLEWIDVELEQARWLLERKRPPAAHLEKAAALLEEIGSAEGFVESARLVQAGKAAYLEAWWRARQGDSPESGYREGAESLRQAMSMNPNEPAPFLELAELLRLQAEWRIETGTSGAAELVGKGIGTADEALAISSEQADAHQIKAQLLTLRADLAAGEERRAAAQAAAQAQARACEINRFLPSCRAGTGPQLQ